MTHYISNVGYDNGYEIAVESVRRDLEEDARRALVGLINQGRRNGQKIVSLSITRVDGGDECEECRGGNEWILSEKTGRRIDCPRCKGRDHKVERARVVLQASSRRE